jgi:hypothetical protein
LGEIQSWKTARRMMKRKECGNFSGEEAVGREARLQLATNSDWGAQQLRLEEQEG